jgi:chaperonin GroEL (HSP60 family)
MSAATCSRGIIDPAKVVRIALQDAASIVGLMITSARCCRSW